MSRPVLTVPWLQVCLSYSYRCVLLGRVPAVCLLIAIVLLMWPRLSSRCTLVSVGLGEVSVEVSVVRLRRLVRSGTMREWRTGPVAGRDES